MLATCRTFELSDRHLLVAETPPETLAIAPRWEKEFLMQFPEIDCGDRSLPLTCLEPFLPEVTHPAFVRTTLRVDRRGKRWTVRGRMYFDRSGSLDMTPTRSLCQFLKRAGAILHASLKPRLHPVLDPPVPLRLPIECPWDMFRSRLDYVGVAPTPMAFGPKTPQEWIPVSDHVADFVRSREKAVLGDWLCHRIHDRPYECICPYSGLLGRIQQPERGVRGGVILGREDGVRTQRMLELATADDQGFTLYLIQQDDWLSVQRLSSPFGERVTLVKQPADVVEGSVPKVAVVTLQQFLSWDLLFRRLRQVSWSRVVVDSGETAEMPFHLLHTKCSFSSLWVLTHPSSFDFFHSYSQVFRLDDYFPPQHLVMTRKPPGALMQGFSQMACLRLPTALQDRNKIQELRLPWPEDWYPADEIVAAVVAVKGQNTPERASWLFQTLDLLHSGRPFRRLDILHTLRRLANPDVIALPDFERLPILQKEEEDDPVCPICQEAPHRPTQNGSCTHVFCYDCLEQWNDIQSNCPCCRSEFVGSFFRVKLASSHAKRRRLESQEPARPPPEVRFRALDLVLSHRLQVEGKILIITHWPSMLETYREAVCRRAPSCQVIERTLPFDDDGGPLEAPVVLTLADNLQRFRRDDRFTSVIVLDHQLGSRTLATILRFFVTCPSVTIFHTEQSPEEMILRHLTRGRPDSSSSLTYLEQPLTELLTHYAKFIL